MNVIAAQKLDRVASKSALSPGLWLVGILAIVLIPATPFLPTWAAILGWALLSVTILAVLGSFLYFSLTKPELLRSDEYSLKAQALAMYGDGKQSPVQISRILSAPAITPQTFIDDRRADV